MSDRFNITADDTVGPFGPFGGEVLVHFGGDFGGGELRVERSLKGGPFEPMENGTWTEGPIDRVVRVPGGTNLQVVLEGATNPSIAAQIG
jgi:hypothetical protein